MYSTPFVVLLGMGTVFAGLILIIILCKLMSIFVSLTDKQVSSSPAASSENKTVLTAIPDKQPMVAAISAVVAEELGTDISNIRIHSIKRV